MTTTINMIRHATRLAIRLAIALTLFGLTACGGGGGGNSGSGLTITPPELVPNISSVSASITADEVDAFHFTAMGKGTLILYTTGNTDTAGTLSRNDETVLVEMANSGGTGNFRIEHYVSSGFAYVIRVSGNNSSTGAYEIIAKFIPEHDNSINTTTTLILGSNKTGRIETTDDVDYFRIMVPGPVGNSGDLTVSTTGSTDTFGSLYGSGQSSPLTTNDNSGADSNFSMKYFVSPGTYYVQVAGANNATGSYDVQATFVAADHGNNRMNATPLVIGEGNSVNGNIEPAGNVDYFRIDVSVGSSIDVTVSTTGDTNTFGSLYGSGQSPLDTDDNSGTGNNFSIDFSASTGIYYVAVEGNATGTYVVQATLAADDHPNTRTNATTLDPDGSGITGQLTPYDFDYFRVDVTTAGNLTVYTTGTTDTYGYLFHSSNSDVNPILQDDDGDPADGTLNFSLTYPVSIGTYYVRVAGNNVTGSYTVHAHVDDHGDSRMDASSLALRSNVDGAINTVGDVDYFSIAVDSSGYLTVTTTGNTDTVGTLYRSSGSSSLATDDNNGTGDNFDLIHFVDSAGTYYIKVEENGNDAIGNYVVRAEFTADDHGSDRVSATVLGLVSNAGVIRGAIGYGTNADFFSITVSGSGSLTVYTTGTTDTTGALYRGTTVLVENITGGGTGNNFSHTQSGVTAGTYYVKVEGGNNTVTGEYDLYATFNSD